MKQALEISSGRFLALCEVSNLLYLWCSELLYTVSYSGHIGIGILSVDSSTLEHIFECIPHIPSLASPVAVGNCVGRAAC